MSSDARLARPEPRPPICSSCGHYESDHTAEGCTAVGMVTSCGCTLPPDAPAPPPRTAIPTGCERGLSVMTCQQLDRCGHHHDANYEWCWVVTDERAYTADEVDAERRDAIRGYAEALYDSEPVPEPSPEQVMRESGAADLWGGA